MKALFVSLALAAVVVVAGALAAHRARGVVAGRVLPSLLRVLALLLVLVGADDGIASDEAAPKPKKGALPIAPAGAREIGASLPLPQQMPAFDPMRWTTFSGEQGNRRSWWFAFKATVTSREHGEVAAVAATGAPKTAWPSALPASLTKLLPDERGTFATATIAEISAALADMEAQSCFDPWLAAFLWRRANAAAGAGAGAGGTDATLLAALERHHRMAHALLLTSKATGLVRYTPWMKKSAPPRDYQGFELNGAEFLATARRLFPSTDAGTWEHDATLSLRVVSGAGGAALVRRGTEVALVDGEPLRLRRLDMVVPGTLAPLVLEHATLGRIELAPGSPPLTSWTVPPRLPAAARADLATKVKRAAHGDAAALASLEAVLPAAHESIAAELRAGDPQSAPGAPALRMMLTTFLE